jgi:hypothetical protein
MPDELGAVCAKTAGDISAHAQKKTAMVRARIASLPVLCCSLVFIRPAKQAAVIPR